MKRYVSDQRKGLDITGKGLDIMRKALAIKRKGLDITRKCIPWRKCGEFWSTK